MNESRIFGGALIASVICLIVTALLHPTGLHGAHSPGDIEPVLQMVVGTHVLAMIGIGLSLVGLVGLSREIGLERSDVVAALVAYGMAVVGGVIAASISGLVGSELTRSMGDSGELASGGLESLWLYSRHVNGAFAKFHVAASSLAILLWSVAMLRARFSRVLAIVGFVSVLLPLAVLFNGRFHMNVHDLMIVVVGQSLWLSWVGVQLMRQAPLQSRTAGLPA